MGEICNCVIGYDTAARILNVPEEEDIWGIVLKENELLLTAQLKLTGEGEGSVCIKFAMVNWYKKQD
jgi:hypothetical protein